MSNPTGNSMDWNGTPEETEFLLSTKAIRQRAHEIFELANKGGTHFSVHLDQLQKTADFVTEVTLGNYPTLVIPFHSRWSHFQVGGHDRLKRLRERQTELPAREQAKAELDLVVTSVLLDAGAGTDWKYYEEYTRESFARSEGLAVASFHMFMQGLFSSNHARRLQVDHEGLENLNFEQFKRAFQISEKNPLVGDEGRFGIIKALGKTLVAKPEYFGSSSSSDFRPGNLIEYFFKVAQNGELRATQILTAVQRGLGSIWPGRVSIEGLNLGDVWPYLPLGEEKKGLVPFHKLSQWLTYSMIEPIEKAGLKVTGVNELTGLAEYRNGGLYLDMEVIKLRDAENIEKAHLPSSELIIEWRALTLVLLEKTAELVRKKLNKTEEEFPLGKVLEGGTWWAGRKVASKLRPTTGGAPLKIQSDGTVF